MEEFCLVVTQRRNVANSSLLCEGASALQWLSMAQCFAGPPTAPATPVDGQPLSLALHAEIEDRLRAFRVQLRA